MATQVPLVAVGLGTSVPPTNADITGHYVVPAGAARVVLRINNGSGASINVTLDDVNSSTPESAQQFNPDVVTAVPAGAARYVALSGARLARFRDVATGRVSWSYSAATTVTVEATTF